MLRLNLLLSHIRASISPLCHQRQPQPPVRTPCIPRSRLVGPIHPTCILDDSVYLQTTPRPILSQLLSATANPPRDVPRGRLSCARCLVGVSAFGRSQSMLWMPCYTPYSVPILYYLSIHAFSTAVAHHVSDLVSPPLPVTGSTAPIFQRSVTAFISVPSMFTAFFLFYVD